MVPFFASHRQRRVVGVGLVAALCSAGCATVAAPAPTTLTPAPTTLTPATALPTTAQSGQTVRTGADHLVAESFASLAGMRVGLIVNQTSVVDGVHLIDHVAQSPQVSLGAVFAPEHGVRGSADAGERVDDEYDNATGAPIFSLYGDTKQPTAAMLNGLDVLIYDLQDVGARFYTYISTMGLAMQAASTAGIPFVVLDRPDPSGATTPSGYVRDPTGVASFVSQYPISSRYALTAGELAHAIAGEQWLDGLESLDLRVVELQGWNRPKSWEATGIEWIPPSPGLPSPEAAVIYPATVLLEATTLSYGKGTDRPFTMVGAPWLDPVALIETLQGQHLAGVEFEVVHLTPDADIAPNPRYDGVEVAGVALLLSDSLAIAPAELGIHLLAAVRDQAEAKGETFIDRASMFDLLAGTPRLRASLARGDSATDIIASWQAELSDFQEVRQRYVRY